MDSLGAVELQNALAREYGVHLPATFIFDFPTVTAINERLCQLVLPPEPAVSPPQIGPFKIREAVRDILGRDVGDDEPLMEVRPVIIQATEKMVIHVLIQVKFPGMQQILRNRAQKVIGRGVDLMHLMAYGKERVRIATEPAGRQWEVGMGKHYGRNEKGGHSLERTGDAKEKQPRALSPKGKPE